MAKKFSEEEKASIRSRLIEQARHCFSTLGLKKTSVADMTKAAGIAQGSFYLFFESKEELYLEILQQEEARIQQLLMERYFSEKSVTKESFRRFLRESFAIMENNPLLRQLHEEETMAILLRKWPPEKLEELFESDSRSFGPAIRRLQEQGIISGEHRTEVIVSLIRSVMLLVLHKKQIGDELFPPTLDLLAELIASGLIRSGDDAH
ncbi:TetR/AcrR family transcriptional regulator [Brevibacillus composti]|uniref:TetR/AcrR family transcriptional regulator n=1 Tax=Brevibacillus composti TaxID=2796470 RepID=A0A7T5JPR3_9BACL|nr:TetR/AcrR family transcriptional regulator [Brevibacillus composti]QQE75375.1 TetR/AcrR family transcriptional regulator [Brevibacillus composti]QUO42401.1 TetR/AcrR family transcriptional regulator [Brevibacillus composti]